MCQGCKVSFWVPAPSSRRCSPRSRCFRLQWKSRCSRPAPFLGGQLLVDVILDRFCRCRPAGRQRRPPNTGPWITAMLANCGVTNEMHSGVASTSARKGFAAPRSYPSLAREKRAPLGVRVLRRVRCAHRTRTPSARRRPPRRGLRAATCSELRASAMLHVARGSPPWLALNLKDPCC